MPISQVNGVPWESITQYVGVLKANISKITSEDKPSIDPTCSTVSFGYSDGGRSPITDACINSPQLYSFDDTNQLLYIYNNCGVSFASAGYYSDGITIYFWDGAESWSVYGSCGR